MAINVTCANCGRAAEPGDTFCGNCGHALAARPAEVVIAPAPPLGEFIAPAPPLGEFIAPAPPLGEFIASPPPRGFPRWILIGGIAALLVLILGGGIFVFTRGDDEASDATPDNKAVSEVKGGTAAKDLPKPPSGKATVGGRFLIDGKPVADEGVTLYVEGWKEGGVKLEAKTDASGRFVFQGVDPGKWTFGTAMTFPQEENTKKCSVPGYTVFSIVGTKNTGERITIASISSKNAFQVKAGDRIPNDVIVTCS